MSIIGKVVSEFLLPINGRAAGGVENPSNPLVPNWWEGGGSGRSDAGITVNRNSALTYSAIWRGVTLKSGDVGKLPLCVYKVVGDGKEKDFDHPAYRLLHDEPNSEMTAFVFKQTLEAHRILQGNGYAYIARKGNGDPAELIPLDPEHTWIVRESGKLAYMTEYQILNGAWERRRIPAADMLHIKGLGYNGLTGYVMTEYGANSIGLGMAAQRYGSKFLANNARPSAVIEVTGNMSAEAQRTFLTQWETMHQGIESSHKTAILTNGAKLNPFSINAKDSQLLETREFEIREISNWIGVPPHKLGDKSRSAYNTLEQENQSYLDDSLDPSLVTWEQECRKKLLTEKEKRTRSRSVEFVRQALVRADLPARYSAYAIAITNGIMNSNEARALENMNPREGGNKYLTPLNMTTNAEADTQTVEEDDEPTELDEPEEEDDVRSAVRRAVAHVGLYANRQAEQPKAFGKWLSEMRVKNLSAVADAILPVSEKLNRTASDVVSRVISEIHSALEVIWSNIPEERFAESIAACVKKLETELPERLANELTKGETP